MSEFPPQSYPASYPDAKDPYPDTQAMAVAVEPAAPTVVGSPPPVAPVDPDQSTVDVAKDQAAQMSHGAVEASQHVAEVAKDQVGTVADEAGQQAKVMLGRARSELTAQAGQQQKRVAEGLHALGEELNAMTQHDGQSGVATDLAHQGAQKSRELASWLEAREPGHLVEEVKSFARQRPGSFLLLAAGLGLAAGRLTRGVKDAVSDGPDTTSDHAAVSTPTVPLSAAATSAASGVGTAARPPASRPLPGTGEYGSTTLSSGNSSVGGSI
jgi:hypothetical protein